jgi:Cu+-exporting ATPase
MLAEVQERVDSKTICYHCGDECRDVLIFEDKHFCCNGCQTVYEILQESGLTDYYSIEKTPGLKQLSIELKEKYDFLDNDSIQQTLHDFHSEELARVTLYIPAIHCSSCIWLLENLDTLSGGIIRSEVNFPRKEVSIAYRPSELSFRKLVETLATVGYEPEISLEKTNAKKDSRRISEVSIKIGVAAFCFGNIMLLSFPEYLGLEMETDLRLKNLFKYINFGLALPVVFYSATEYFQSAWNGLKSNQSNIDIPIALGIIALFARSSYEIFFGIGAGYLDSLAGLVFFLLIGKWFQSKTYQHLSFERDYKSYFPLSAKVESEEGLKTVLIKDLCKGDHIQIRNNEIIPTDALLLDEAAEIDYSFVTGESRKIVKNKGEILYAGGRNMGKTMHARVEKQVSQSFLTRIWNSDIFNKQNDQDRTLINKISKHFTLAVLTIAFISSAYWWFVGGSDPMLVLTSVLIVACPCALALATPFTYGNVLRILGRNKFYLKRAGIAEQFLGIKHIVFDKTGTLTDIANYKVTYQGKELLPREWSHIKQLIGNSTHPLSRRITEYLKFVAPSEDTIEAYKEIPGKGISARMGYDQIKIGSSFWICGGETSTKHDASSVSVEINGEQVGLFVLQPAYRNGLGEMVKTLLDHFKLSVLSGDHDYDKNKIRELMPGIDGLFFDQSPEDKMIHIRSLKKHEGAIMMIGDGLNDAGALKQADIGIAVADSASNFTPSCDAIIEGSQLQRLNQFISLILRSRYIVIGAFTLSFLYNVVGLSFAVTGNLTPVFAAILMPISSISVVALTTLAVNMLARSLKLS